MKKRNLFISSFIVLITVVILAVIGYFMKQNNIIQDTQKTAKESEVYEENSKIRKLSSIAVQPMQTATASGTVTIQQGNLYAYVDTALTSSPENAGQFRSTFGIGEKVVLVAQFDKLIKSTANVKATIQFGTGALISLNGRISGSTIIFEHALRENVDNGVMKVIGLSGTVTDNDDNTIQIGLPQSGVHYTQSNSIIADTTKPVLTEFSLTSNEPKTEFYARFVYNDNVYIKENNTLRNLNSQELQSLVYFTFTADGQEYRGKGSVTNCLVTSENGQTVCTYTYRVTTGDYGIPVAWIKPVSDIAGNLNKQANTGVVGTDLSVSTDIHTPYITNIEYTANGNVIQSNEGMARYNYCKAGKIITINVTFNEKVYANNNAELTAQNATPIYLNIGGAVKSATFSNKSADGRTITYTYTVQPGDNGDLEMITVPNGAVYDNVGHQSVATARECAFIIIDTTAPVVTSIMGYDNGIYRAGVTISYKVTFSEDVTDGYVITSFSEGINEEYGGMTSNGWSSEKTVIFTFRKGDNGFVKARVNNGAFQDKAGNEVVEKSLSIDTLYADTTPPEISISSNETITNKNIVRYYFSLTDNSSNWATSPRGIASHTFTVDDIDITNGKIVESGNDVNGNISYIDVLVDNDGKQRVYIGKNKIFDVAKDVENTGNGNDKFALNDSVLIDTKVPQITNIEKTPSEWTNKDVTLTVYAYDDGSGIKEYSFDGGETWQQEKTKTYTENTSGIEILVKDMVGNINTYSEIINIDNIDKEPPAVGIRPYTLGDGYVIMTGDFKKSGVASCTINGIPVPLENSEYVFIPEENGTYIITVTDNAGNSTTENLTIDDIDDKAPVITNIMQSPTEWTNQNVTLKVYAYDDGSGIKEYSFDGGETWQTTDTFEVENNKQSLMIQVKDNNENVTTKEINITNIDKEDPLLSIEKIENGKENTIIRITATDGISGISNCEISGTKVNLTNGTYEFIVKSNGIYIVTVKDNAGNIVQQEVDVTNIDDSVDANIIFENNGGEYILDGNRYIKLENKIYITNAAISKIEYAWTTSKELPSEWIFGGTNEILKVEKDIIEEGNYYLHVKVTDSENNITIGHSNVFVVEGMPIILDESLRVENFENINYIVLVKSTEKEELMEKMQTTKETYSIKIKDKNFEEYSEDKLKTGDIVTVEGAGDNEIIQYKICIKGDINADGEINMSDIFKLNKYRLGKIQLDNDELLAGDVNSDKTINMKDIFQINKYRLGKIENL